MTQAVTALPGFTLVTPTVVGIVPLVASAVPDAPLTAGTGLPLTIWPPSVVYASVKKRMVAPLGTSILFEAVFMLQISPVGPLPSVAVNSLVLPIPAIYVSFSHNPHFYLSLPCVALIHIKQHITLLCYMLV